MSQLEPISGFFEENGLELERYPQQSDDPTLQAWEAADEYLLQSFDLPQAEGRPVDCVQRRLWRVGLCTAWSAVIQRE